MGRQLGAFRGLAIMLVVLAHSIEWAVSGLQLGQPFPAGRENSIFIVLRQFGVFAVPTFLFISGCFFSYAMVRSCTRLAWGSWKPVWNSVKHVLWPYFVWSIAFYLMVYLWRAEQTTPLGYVTHLIVGYPFDFVPLLVFWYVMSPFLARLSNRYGWLLIGVMAIYQLVLLNFAVPGILGFHWPDSMHFLVPKAIGHTMAFWGVYFPLGLVCGLKARSLNALLCKYRWPLRAATAGLFVISLLNEFSIVQMPLTAHLAAFTFALCLPIIKRESIPLYRPLEEIGKRSYGLYLTNLIVLTLCLLAVNRLIPALLNYQLLLGPLLFVAALLTPIAIMRLIERLPTHTVYRYVFG